MLKFKRKALTLVQAYLSARTSKVCGLVGAMVTFGGRRHCDANAVDAIVLYIRRRRSRQHTWPASAVGPKWCADSAMPLSHPALPLRLLRVSVALDAQQQGTRADAEGG
jgi:hypothetical protein